jgi:hypothetical protein
MSGLGRNTTIIAQTEDHYKREVAWALPLLDDPQYGLQLALGTLAIPEPNFTRVAFDSADHVKSILTHGYIAERGVDYTVQLGIYFPNRVKRFMHLDKFVSVDQTTTIFGPRLKLT